eukprot:gene8405-9886_t
MKNFYNSFRLMGIVPGLEFKMAIDEAEAVKANIVLGDLPFKDTMKNLSSALMSEMMPLMMGASRNQDLQAMNQILGPLASVLAQPSVTEEELDREFKKVLTNQNLDRMRSGFSRALPQTYDALLVGRERYITDCILQCKGNKVLAVVGALHVNGVKDLLNERK